jgi:hypothetical protein
VKAGFLAVWDINADGSLSTNFRTVGGGVLPFSLNHIPGKNALVASDPGVGYDIFDLDSNARTAGVSVPIPKQGANCWSVYSKQSGNFYIIDVGTSTLTEVHVTSSLNSTIVKASPHYVAIFAEIMLIFSQQYSVAPAGPIDSDVATIGKNEWV